MKTDWLTTAQVCEELQIKDGHPVHKLIKSGALLAVNISSGKRPTWRISREALNAFMASRQTRPPAPKPARRTKDPNVIEFF